MDERNLIAEGTSKCRRAGRRDFFKRVGNGGIVAAAGASWLAAQAGHAAPSAESAPSASAPPAPAKKMPPLPTIKIGDKTVTRMIVGGNPVQGYAHTVQALAQHMMEYFTVEQTAKFLLHCEEMGINTFQSSYSDKVRDALLKAWESGSKLQFICLTADDPTQTPLEKVIPLKPIGISHHGVVTDSRFGEGKQELIHDYIKKVHDLGMLAGMSSHNPKNIQAAEEKGWENDFFMTCFYNVVRTDEDLKRDFGAIPVGELYLADDPIKMTETVRQSKKVCLGFKILAAGRLAMNSGSVQRAFQFAFKSIKPTDGVIVGMYPRFSDQAAENTNLVRRLAAVKG